MYRFIYGKSLFSSNIQYVVNNPTHALCAEIKIPPHFCSYCRNTIKNHITPVSDGFNSVRHQSTHSFPSPRTVKKKTKTRYSRKYVELLEVNEKDMKETKAHVSKFKAVHLSKLASRPEVTLGELHRLTSNQSKTQKQPIANTGIDLDLLKDIENVILNNSSKDNSSLIEDNGAIIFVSKHVPNVQKLFQKEDRIKFIKDSYDKFRRETMHNQIIKDFSFLQTQTDAIDNKFDVKNETKNTKDIQGLYGDYFLNSDRVLSDELMMDEDTHFEDIGLNPDLNQILTEEGIQHDDIIEEDGANIAFPVSKPNKSTKKKKIIKSEETAKEATLKTKAKKRKKNQAVSEEASKRNQLMYMLGKEMSLTKLLCAHLETSIHVGHLEKAHRILVHYRNRGKRSSQYPTLNNINLYNIILNGYAAKGDFNGVNEILTMLKEDNIDLNIQSYAIIFECIERSNMDDKYLILNKFWNELKEKKISLNSLIEKCVFVRDQRQLVISAISRLNKNFIPVCTKPVMDYNCTLVNNLNPKELHKKVGIYKEHNHFTSPAQDVITMEKLTDQINKQIMNETTGLIEIQNIEVKNQPSKSVIYYRQKLEEIEKEWREVIRKAFLRNVHSLKAQSNASNSALNIYPYLIALEVNEYVDLLMLEIRKIGDGSETYSPSVKALQRDIGVKVYNRYQINKMKNNDSLEKIVNLYMQYCDWYLNRGDDQSSEAFNSRRKWQQLLHENQEGVSLNVPDNLWPNTVCVNIGKFLYNILVNDVKIDANVLKMNSKKSKPLPLLYNIFRGKKKVMRQEIKPHPLLPRLIRESMPAKLIMESILAPSLSPPLPWTDSVNGGYLLSKTPVIRIPSNTIQQIEKLKECPPQNLYPALDSLNQLGAVPWIVNKPVLDVLLNVFRSGGSHSLNVARPSSSVSQVPPASSTLSRRERAAILQKRAVLARIRQEMHSLWCDALYKLSLANHYRDEVFWLPHNMDFRGRVYPCPPHLSHLGADTSRALLVFARGRPLGPKGLSWLKLHCINLTGTMKRDTVQERLNYAETILDEIFDSADNPLNGKRWWAKSDEPWQTLAVCIEIANAMRSPNPEEYVCHFPIHQDGSCNGLQHYAALGGDSAGAFSVNLSNADRPQDVYSAVVALVEANRAKDAANGVKIATLLQGFVNRKVIKQTVMTTVYGVTKFGARLQIAKQLKDIDSFPKDQVWTASSYLTIKTFESLQEMFTSTKEIQDWFTECAKLISGVCGAKIEWVTPMGLPVVQPYFKITKVYNNHVGGGLNEYCTYDQFEKPCVLKQKNAFPPNFIHSLDSSHMMLTSLHCEASDITFVSVHDCFWTHPSSVEIMNKICREQFVALHSQPILENLSRDLVKKYSFDKESLVESGNVMDTSKRKLNIILRKLPPKGDFDLKNVLKSVYFFS